MMQVREKTKEEITAKLSTMKTPLTRMDYLESIMKSDFPYDVQRLIFDELAKAYEERIMYDKAARVFSMKGGIEVTQNKKVEAYLRAAELFAKAWKIEEIEAMYVRALREAETNEKKREIKLAIKNIFLVNASELEKKQKRSGALKFYEKLMKIDLDESEKSQVKEKLIAIYKSLGKFREVAMLQGKGSTSTSENDKNYLGL